VLELIRNRYEQGAVVAAICHGPWLLVSAGLVEGRKATGSLGIKDDLENAGAIWVDESAFVDGQLVWGRVVADIPNFCKALVTRLREYVS
jgi:protease I